MIRVIVADDHPVVRTGLRGMLDRAEGIEVLGEAGDGDEAIALVERHQPDVVLMDLQMPGRDGASATRAITEAHPDVSVLVLTTFAGDEDVARAVEAGAAGYLLKDSRPGALVDGIRAVARDETVLAPAAAAQLMSRIREPDDRAATLTPREREVLGGVARGLSNPEIAAELGIGPATVKTHLQRAFAKLDVDDRTQAVMVALERGLLPRS